MMTVEISETRGVFFIHIHGHAGYAESGSDIVCSAASILTYTLAEILFSEEFEKEPMIDLTDGEARILCAPTEENEQKIRSAFEFVETGFTMLAQEYPNYIRLVSGK